jgi:hypothetical protein
MTPCDSRHFDPRQLLSQAQATYRLGIVLALGVLSLAGCVTARDTVSEKEDHLAAAGFIIRPANTPERQQMLNRLPPHHFVKRVHGDVVHYVYADPLVCDCLYVGSQQAYSKYQQYLLSKSLADEQETTAQMYADPMWNWGPWGAGDMGYGFEYGTGMGW